MRKQDLIKDVSQRVKQPESVVGAVVNSTFDAIRDSLAGGEEVTITGFGSFRITERAAREGRNPQTRERIVIPAGKSPSFGHASGPLAANRPTSHSIPQERAHSRQ